MPSTVIVNNMTVVHASSGGVTQIFPDACKTPAPPAPVPPPIPYPNVAMSSDTAQGSSTVTCDGNPVMIKSSNFQMSTGDEAGVAGGVVSNKIKGKAEPKLFSMDVKFDGENVMRLSDIMLQNIGGSPNTPPGTEVQAPAVALGGDATPKDPEKPEVTRMEWKKSSIVCGDKVVLDVDTKNFPSGDTLAVTVQRKQPTHSRRARQDGRPQTGPVHDTLQVKINGDKGSYEWVSRQWRWGKKADVTGKQELFKGVTKSNEMEMKTVPEVAQEKVPVTPSPDPGQFIIWDAGFFAEIKKGQFIVTRKVEFRDGTKNRVPGARPNARMKRKLKKQIEKVWSGKWKLHRTSCERGDKCDCSAEYGCCTFVITVVCEWAGGFAPVGWNPGPNAASGWAPFLDAHGTPVRGPQAGWVLMRDYFANPDHQKWWYSHEWWEGRQNLGNAAAVAAHEFGHLLGLHDEYTGGANLFDPIHKVPVAALVNVPGSIMNSGWNTHARHFGDMKKWFDAKADGVLGQTKLLKI